MLSPDIGLSCRRRGRSSYIFLLKYPVQLILHAHLLFQHSGANLIFHMLFHQYVHSILHGLIYNEHTVECFAPHMGYLQLTPNGKQLKKL